MNRNLFKWILLAGLLTGCNKEKDAKTESKKDTSFVQSASKAGPPTTSPSILQWQKTFGSSLNEIGYVIVPATDGNGYILAGNTLGNDGDVYGNHGGSDVWVVKIDFTGAILWQKTFGGSAGDYAYDIVATSDGGYVFAGMTQSSDGDVSGFHGTQDVWVVKLTSSGTIAWQKTLGGSGSEYSNSIIQASDGGYLVAAYTQSTNGDVTLNHGGMDAWIIKLNSSGGIDWQKTYGGSLNESAASIVPTPDGDGNFMVSAAAHSTDGDLSTQPHHGGSDAWLFKIDGAGNLLWQKEYGGSGDEGAGAVLATADGGYIFSANTTSNNGEVSGNHGYADTWLVKISSAGNISWQKCFGGNDMDNADIKNIDAAGNILLVGYTFSRNGDIVGYKGGEDFWVLLTDKNGNRINSSVLGGKSGDAGEDAIPTADGMYLGIGRTASTSGDVTTNHGINDIWVVKFKFPPTN